MGDSLSSCCTHTQNLQLGRQIITLQNSEGYDQMLKTFLGKHHKIGEQFSKKWSYCRNVDKSVITLRNDDIFVGKLDPSDETHELIVMYSGGYLYEGEFVSYKREGLGRLISADGDCYEGKWHNDQPHGEGIYQGVSPKRKYIGSWQQGFLQGKGKAIFQDGSLYDGQFHSNLRHGKGTIKYIDGSIYEGDFKNNIIQGFGTLIGINHKYEGSWRSGKMDGAGKSSWFNDDDEVLQTYEGQYENGVKHGKGQYRWSNGRVFKGEWFQGEIRKPRLEKNN